MTYNSERDLILSRALYEGDKKLLNSPTYLKQLPSETAKVDGNLSYQMRQRHTWYRNELRSIISKWTDELLDCRLIFDVDFSENFGSFLASCRRKDKKIQSFESFIGYLSQELFLQGSCAVLVDRTKNAADPYTYVILYTAEQILKKEETEDGEILEIWVTYKKGKDQVVDIWEKTEQNQVVKSSYKAVHGTHDFDPEKATLLERVDLFIDKLPFIVCDLDGDWTDSIADQLLELHNKRSILSMVIAQQGHLSRYLKTSRNLDTLIDQSIHSILKLDQGDEYGQLDPLDPSAIKSEVDDLRAEIRQKAFRKDRAISTDSKETQAKESIEAENLGMQKAIQSARDQIKTFVNQILSLVVYYEGYEPDLDVDLFDFRSEKNLQGQDLQDLILLTQVFASEIQTSPTFRMEILTRILTCNLLDLQPSMVAEILTELNL